MKHKTTFKEWAIASLVTFILSVAFISCTAPVTPVTPAPMADVAPDEQPQKFDCALSGNNESFVMECAEPLPTVEPTATATAEPTATMTPEPTPTEAPSFYYFWCDGDTRCASGQFRVYWDRDLTMLRCALPVHSKVTRVAEGYSLREGEGEPLAWVVTGADAGGKACEGWVPVTFLTASN